MERRKACKKYHENTLDEVFRFFESLDEEQKEERAAGARRKASNAYARREYTMLGTVIHAAEREKKKGLE